MGAKRRAIWGPIPSILVLAPILVVLPLYTLHRQFCESEVKNAGLGRLYYSNLADFRFQRCHSLMFIRKYSSATPSAYFFDLYFIPSYDPKTNLPHPSEATILSYAKHLSEGIGYRTPGTREHAIADAWLFQKVQDIGQLCRQAVEKEPDRKLECTVWRQEGSGSHRCVDHHSFSLLIPNTFRSPYLH